MISIGTKIHDKFSIEFKVGFVTRRKARKNDFTVGMWMFVPSSLDITPYTYTKADFYRDVKTNIRLITPSFILRDICGGEAIPLHNVKAAAGRMASDPTRTNTDDYIYQVKMFAAVVKSSLRDETAYIRRSPERDMDFLVKSYADNIRNIINTYRELSRDINVPSVPASALEVYDLAGEFICSVSTNHICRLLKDLKSREGQQKNCELLVELCHFVDAFRQERGYPLGNDLYRHGILKKSVESQLYLRVPKKKDGFLIEQAYFSLAAGMAMIFATVVAWAFQRHFGNLTWPLFIALIISYMMKDRIKELMRFYFAHRVGDRYFDNKAKIKINNREIGSLKEAVDFIPLGKVPEQIRKLRGEHRIFPSDSAHNDERVILYKKVVKLDREKMMANSNWKYSGVNDIIRLQVNSFLRKMDNPLVEWDCVDAEGNVRAEMLPKYYYINIVLEYHYDDVTDYKHLRITLTRDGIQKIEDLS